MSRAVKCLWLATSVLLFSSCAREKQPSVDGGMIPVQQIRNAGRSVLDLNGD